MTLTGEMEEERWGSSLLGCGCHNPSIDFTDGDRPCLQEDANALFKELSLGGDSISVDAAGHKIATFHVDTQKVSV